MLENLKDKLELIKQSVNPTLLKYKSKIRSILVPLAVKIGLLFYKYILIGVVKNIIVKKAIEKIHKRLSIEKHIKKLKRPNILAPHKEITDYFKVVHKIYFNMKEILTSYVSQVQIVISELIPFNVLKRAKDKYNNSQKLKEVPKYVEQAKNSIEINSKDIEKVKLNLAIIDQITIDAGIENPSLVKFLTEKREYTKNMGLSIEVKN